MALEVFPSEPNLKLNEKCNIDKCNLKKSPCMENSSGARGLQDYTLYYYNTY